MSYYYFPLIAADWLADPKLSMCLAVTRGIWLDAKCAMFLRNREGVLSGTPEQLARICRCRPAEMSAAATELHAVGLAEVTLRNGVLTLVCPSMNGEHKKRKSVAQRVKRHRAGGVTQKTTKGTPESNSDVTDTRAPESDSELESERREKAEKKDRVRGTPEQLSAYAVSIGLLASDGQWLADKMLAQGWMVDGKPGSD